MRLCRPALASFLGGLGRRDLTRSTTTRRRFGRRLGSGKKESILPVVPSQKNPQVKFYQSNSIHLSPWRWVLMQVTGLGYRLCDGLVTCNANGIRFCYKHGTYGSPPDMPLVIKCPGAAQDPTNVLAPWEALEGCQSSVEAPRAAFASCRSSTANTGALNSPVPFPSFTSTFAPLHSKF